MAVQSSTQVSIRLGRGGESQREARYVELPAAEAGQLVSARAGDHLPIQQMLREVLRGPSPAEFHALTEEPLYEPSDRLLIKQGRRVLGHVHAIKQVTHFGGSLLPTGLVQHLAVLPEHRGKGYGRALLAAVEEKMKDDGATIGLLRSHSPGFFSGAGWANLGRCGQTAAGAREILSYLDSRRGEVEPPPPSLTDEAPPPLSIRLWRHVEQDALVRLYDDYAARHDGARHRTHDYWRWLISRQAYDRICVAIEGDGRLELDQINDAIAGYMVVRGERIVELVGSQRRPEATTELLARACSDAIERDEHLIRFDAPADDPLAQMMRAAGGAAREREAAGKQPVLMAKVLDLPKTLDGLRQTLDDRAKAAGLEDGAELGLSVGGDKFRLALSRRGLKIESGKTGRSHLKADAQSLTRMLLGRKSPTQLADDGALKPSTKAALQLGDALFPQHSFHLSAFDDLPAR